MQTSTFSQFAATSAIDKSGLVRGVSVITANVEALGHGLYTDAKTLQTVHQVATGFKDGVKVKADHGSGVGSIIGTLKNFRIDGDRVRADLYMVKSHRDFAYFAEIIQTQPSNIGLSISFSYTTETIDKKPYIRISDLFSCDVVSQPAANPTGLFSADTTPRTFGRAVAQFCLGGMTPAEAVEKAVQQHPALYTEWRNGGCVEPLLHLDTPGNFAQLVNAQQRHGKSKADAVRYCISKFPEAYQSWRTSGDTSHL